jgi:Flp pilus assembly protein TadG
MPNDASKGETLVTTNDNRRLQPLARNQRGIALPLVVVGMVAMLAMAGLALDSSHAFVNNTRLQNTADAAALAAAKVYDQTRDTMMSTAAANGIFGQNTNASGNFEVDAAYDAGDISVVVQYSETLMPFTPGPDGPYVRVIATGFSMLTSFSNVVGINSMDVSASAVAGPSPAIVDACNIAPLVVCAADMTQNYFGFQQDKLMVLKPNPGDHSDVGPGNYKLLRLNCPGGDCVRDAMAGSYENCASVDQTMETEPGVTAGPTEQGFNTRFGEWNGPISPDDYPADVVTDFVETNLDTYVDGNGDDVITMGPGGAVVSVAADIPGQNYGAYVNATINGPHNFSPDGYPRGKEWRRVLALPVADCSGDESGQSTLQVEGFACYYMLQRIGGGPEKNIYGQFVDGCLAGGVAGQSPGSGPGPYLIQLYKNPDSEDS